MTEIYLQFRCVHYRLYGNAPVALSVLDRDTRSWCCRVAHIGSMAASAAREEDLLCRHTPRRTTRHSYGLERHNGQALGHPQDGEQGALHLETMHDWYLPTFYMRALPAADGEQGAQRCRDNSRRHS